MKIDLHTHSYYSDGWLSPVELIREAEKAELDAIALTDHESVGGIPEAVETGVELGLKVIPGIELAVIDHEGGEQHLLGLYINHENQELRDFIEKWKESRVRQIKAIIKNLQAKGFKIELEEAVKQAKGSLNRIHIGWAIVRGKRNLEILERFDINTPSDFFNAFLAESGRETAFAPKENPSVQETIELIQKINGIAVWAHPCWKNQDIADIERKCRVFQDFGLGAIEVCYSRFFLDCEGTIALHKLAEKLGLYETAGSDFHSFGMPKFNKLADFETFGLELRLPIEKRGGI